jgi:hypothetical protein
MAKLMAIKRLSKEKLEQVENYRLAWLEWHNKLRQQPIHSDLWFAQLRERNACYDLLMQLTGLTRSRVDNLIYGQVTAATFWLADGTIRRNHPHE